jgi:hypothetical protein
VVTFIQNEKKKLNFLYMFNKSRSYFKIILLVIIVCLFICFESHEQFFSYLVTVTIAGDRTACMLSAYAF